MWNHGKSSACGGCGGARGSFGRGIGGFGRGSRSLGHDGVSSSSSRLSLGSGCLGSGNFFFFFSIAVSIRAIRSSGAVRGTCLFARRSFFFFLGVGVYAPVVEDRGISIVGDMVRGGETLGNPCRVRGPLRAFALILKLPQLDGLVPGQHELKCLVCPGTCRRGSPGAEAIRSSPQDVRKVANAANQRCVGPEKPVHFHPGTKNVAAQEVQRLKTGSDGRQVVRDLPLLGDWFGGGALSSGLLCLTEGLGGSGLIKL